MYKSDSKVHYKMYKAGKNWIFSAITIIGISSGIAFLSTSTSVHADSSTQVVQTGASKTADKPNTSDQTEITSVPQSETNKTDVSTNNNQTNTIESKSVPQTETSKAETSSGSEKPENAPVPQSATNKIDTSTTNDQAEKPENVSVAQPEFSKSDTENVSDQTDKTKSVAISQPEAGNTDTSSANNQTDKPENTSTNQTDTSKTNTQDINAQTDKTKSAPKTSNLKSNLINMAVTDNKKTTDPNIKVVDGKTYYYGDDGKPKKNYTVIVDGKVLHFDNDTGALQSSENKFHDGLVTISNEHNAAYGLTPDNFTNVNGYLTASSWYRPKDILENGSNWVPSTNYDFRPLLMTWWPDVNTQMAYLNYMKNINLLSQDTDFTDSNNQEALTNASMLAQANIEKRIWQQHDIKWLKDDIEKFIDSQSNWNINSESKGNDHLQGGALKYVNSDLTPNANSDYRLLNRTPTNQDGKVADSSQQGGYDFLLANDVDNSNPVVQAEQLNWLHYMMNIGTITANDATANFDGYRVDAVDNVDADLLQVASDYAKAAYGTNKNDANANSHLSILEDWTNYDAQYIKEHGNNQLTMDFPDHLALKYSLNMPISQRSGLEPTMSTSLVNRTGENSTENTAQPNYSFIRAHDSEVQTVIAEIIKSKINPNSDGLTVTPEEIKQAFKIYNEDELQADKKYTAYNIPSSYALLLTNKDTVPRVYYGDLYTDDGQYMEKQSPYYDAIVSLLKGRVKYVSGGQYMGIQYVNGDNSMPSDSYRGVLTSVRYGQDAMTADALGNDATRTQGLAVIVSNNPDLRLNSNDSVVVNMGAAHKNQAYRPLLLTTKDGLKNYTSDDNAPIMYTNDLGQLIFKSDSVFGISDPQVSGYVSVWVPVGASEDQDARTQSDTAATNDGYTYHSNAALDSQLIYEGFSNFQAMPVNAADYANVKIAQNVDLFKSLGITSFELAPQYRSSTDSSFLDSVVQNGYAFTDRYDIGYGTPTKYGTVNQLLDCLRSLHGKGIQAINDWVPDQIYNLPGEEIVTAQRTNNSGIPNSDSVINNTLYDSRTIGGGKYQAIYGGAFLEQLKNLYPELFKVNQISTGQPMNPNVRITEWSAKYFNGSNIQGRGAWYVLKDWATNKYFNVSSDNLFLPKQYLGEKVNAGFTSKDGKTIYYSDSGYQARDTFIQNGNDWYYFDDNGYMATGFQTIKDTHYFFLPNGVELRNGFLADKDAEYYYDKNGKQVSNQYYQFDNGDWAYFFKDGKMAKGKQEINGQHLYFNSDGIQVKGDIVKNDDGTINYYDANSGEMLKNKFGELPDGRWVYLDNDGNAVKGKQEINGQHLYFNSDGIQVKGDIVKNDDGTINYYDANSGEMLKNKFGKLSDGRWVYLDNKGNAVKGKQVIDGKQLYFDQNGIQVKGNTVKNNDGTINYYDADSGEMVKDKWIKLPNGVWKYFDKNGNFVK